MGNITITELILPLLILAIAIYVLVRFVKWSWNRK